MRRTADREWKIYPRAGAEGWVSRCPQAQLRRFCGHPGRRVNRLVDQTSLPCIRTDSVTLRNVPSGSGLECAAGWFELCWLWVGCWGYRYGRVCERVGGAVAGNLRHWLRGIDVHAAPKRRSHGHEMCSLSAVSGGGTSRTTRHR